MGGRTWEQIHRAIPIRDLIISHGGVLQCDLTPRPGTNPHIHPHDTNPYYKLSPERQQTVQLMKLK